MAVSSYISTAQVTSDNREEDLNKAAHLRLIPLMLSPRKQHPTEYLFQSRGLPCWSPPWSNGSRSAL